MQRQQRSSRQRGVPSGNANGVLGKRDRHGSPLTHSPPLPPPAVATPSLQRQYCDVFTSTPAQSPNIFLPASTPAAALDCDTSLLSAMLHPLPLQRFRSEYWRRKAVAVTGCGAARLQQLVENDLCGLDVRALMADSESEQIFVWMKETGAASSASSASAASVPITSFPLENPAQLDAALACYNSGSSLYFRSPASLSRRLVRALNSAVQFNFAGLDASTQRERGEVEVFVSRAGHHTGWHLDFMENFTLQLRGSKRWTVSASSLTHPLRGWTPHYSERGTDELQLKAHAITKLGGWDSQQPQSGDEVTLQAGDVLYHPAGIWHCVNCSEDSVSINVSLIAASYADIVSDAVRQMMWTTETGREGVCGDRPHVLQQLSSALEMAAELLKRLRADDIVTAGMWRPRRRTLRISLQEDVTQHEVASSYRHNPLSTLVKLGVESEAESEQEEEEEEGAGDEEADEAEQGAEEEVEEGKEQSVPYVRYAYHHLYGNEALDSALRVVLLVPAALQAAVDSVVAISLNFSFDEFLQEEVRHGTWTVHHLCLVEQMSGQSDDGLRRVLKALCEIGYLTPADAASSKRK